MQTVTVSKIPNSVLLVKVCLLDLEWQDLHPKHLVPFHVHELLRVCSIYPDGLFPGGNLIPDQPGRQSSRVYCFLNYLEWSRVTEEDVDDNGGNNMYLTTNFFDQRRIGWSELTHKVKLGTTVGYCFNGTAYSIEDKDAVQNIVYKTVYKQIIKDKHIFKRLQDIVKLSSVELSGADLDVLKVLAETLLS